MNERPATIEELQAAAALQQAEARERLITIVLMLSAGITLQAMHAPEALVGGALGAAAVLVKSNASRGATIAASGVGAVIGAIVGGWLPVLA